MLAIDTTVAMNEVNGQPKSEHRFCNDHAEITFAVLHFLILSVSGSSENLEQPHENQA